MKGRTRPTYFVGLDLGQQNDFTAIAVLEDVTPPEDSNKKTLHIRHLERFKDRLYPDVAERVETLLETPPLKDQAALFIDATGVGPAVTDIFKKRGRKFKAVKIHGGDAETRSDGFYRVPKRNLVSVLQVLLQSGNPKIVSEMLGHSSIAITLDTYSHVLPTMQESAIRALEDALK
jgi:integrase